MSIIKYINGKNQGPHALTQGINYILNPEKTSHSLVAGNGINPATAAQDMQTTQSLLRSNVGRSHIHIVLSFDKTVSSHHAFRVSKECAAYFAEDFQYLLAIHTNTANVHAHIVLNAVNIHTGHKFSQSRKEMLHYRDYVNDCLLAHGLLPIGKTTTDLYCEETFVEYESEFEYYLEPDTLPENEVLSSFLGVVDPDELEQIQQGLRYNERLEMIIDFFEGNTSTLPRDITYEDAYMHYTQWQDSQTYLQEEETHVLD